MLALSSALWKNLAVTPVPQHAEWPVRLLAFVGGVASTVAGSWISSKIHVYHDSRKAHLEDLKKQVLVPLRDALEHHLRPLVFHQVAVISVHTGATTEVLEKPKVTEAQTRWGDVLTVASPRATIFSSVDSALLQDARKSHFDRDIARVDALVSSCEAYAHDCHVWVESMALEILRESGLPGFPNLTGGPGYKAYVMHHRLAVFVYKRLFGIQTAPLRISGDGGPEPYRTLTGEDAAIALGSLQEMEALVQELNGLLESEGASARILRDKATKLQIFFSNVVPALDYAIASRRLRGQCDLVPFF